MRLLAVTIPAGCLLACLGGLFWLEAQVRSQTPYSKSVDIISSEPRHLVTPQMTKETAAQSDKPAPTFQAKDVTGALVDIGSHAAARPQFVYFVVDGCPCCFDAEPLYHDLYKQFKGEIDFVSVTNGDLDKAKVWNSEVAVPYAVVPDPKERIIHAFGAKSALYSCLISRDGRIVKMWPGYSKDLLKEMNEVLAKEAGVAPKPFDTKYAPLTRATGCAFSATELK